jgi:hypothetical protein
MTNNYEIGFAGDLFLPSKKYLSLTGQEYSDEKSTLISICDLFLIYEKVLFRAEPGTILWLLTAFKYQDLKELVKNNKLSFFCPKYNKGYNVSHFDYSGIFNINDTLEEKLFLTLQYGNNSGLLPEKAETKIINLIYDNLVTEKTNETFSELESNLTTIFYNSFNKTDSKARDSQIGNFEYTINKIRELWGVGAFSIYYDWDFLYAIDRCEKAAFLKNTDLGIKYKDMSKSIIDDLHYFKNIPSIAEILYRSKKPTSLFLEIINSNEAAELRKWLGDNLQNNIDVRDLYQKSISKLPSKNKWIDWFRFGSVSLISSILASILTSNPTIGFIIGTSVGTIDKLYGDKTINSISPNYNPENWVNFIERKIK